MPRKDIVVLPALPPREHNNSPRATLTIGINEPLNLKCERSTNLTIRNTMYDTARNVPI